MAFGGLAPYRECDDLSRLFESPGRDAMPTTMNMVYWKGEKFWVGKLLDHPDIMSQGETVEELEANLREAYLLMAMDDVPEEHSIKPIAI